MSCLSRLRSGDGLKQHPLFVIVFCQLLGTSLWFTPNGVAHALQQEWQLSLGMLGSLTASVQLGFICGTLAIALSGFADRFRASRIFACSALVGALCNLLFIFTGDSFALALFLRFLTGLALAGIYPLGMKLVVSWTPHKTGQALSWLVAMLTLGTASPHLLQGLGHALPWSWVLLSASMLAVIAAWLIACLGEGEHLPKAALRRSGLPGFKTFKLKPFRAAALAYFGHCWELYAFWTLTPIFLSQLFLNSDLVSSGLSWLAFLIIAIGALGCVLGGRLSREFGSARVAWWMLALSASCCLIWPWVSDAGWLLGLLVLLIWGFSVIADSPHYSALAAITCPREEVGSALALMNSIGFLMTVFSISLSTQLYPSLQSYISWLLLPGALLGLLTLKPLLQKDPTHPQA